MANALFEFTAHPNSYSVHIPNLEELSVAQIQEIEHFVTLRKGVFDFFTYSFSIQKKIDFFEFQKTLQHTLTNVDVLHKKQKKIKKRESLLENTRAYFIVNCKMPISYG